MKELVNTMDAAVIADISAPGNQCILSIVNDEGYPHAVIIDTLRAKDGQTLMWAKLTYGQSKKLLLEKKECAFACYTKSGDVLQGWARYSESVKQGADFEAYNDLPQFRYNAYSGIDVVYYMELLGISGKKHIDREVVAENIEKTKETTGSIALKGKQDIFTPLVRQLMEQSMLTSLSVVGRDGRPWVIPVPQAMPLGNDRVVFMLSPFGEDLRAIAPGSKANIHFCTDRGEVIFIQGIFEFVDAPNGVQFAWVNADKIYNATSPRAGYIYPRAPLTAIREFL